MPLDHVDVLIVGAGLSGIGAACHLQRRCPGKTFAIVEARDAIGGTWDLFRFPGVRSDSDMLTLGLKGAISRFGPPAASARCGGEPWDPMVGVCWRR
jgi:cation diffusion facilitator CzcD-associated flavoprotein CzcO